MSNRFPLILLASLVVISGIVWTAVSIHQSSLVRLDGSVLKVRTFPLTPESTLLMVDFRVNNPTRLPFVVEKVEMFVDRSGGDPAPGDMLSRADVDRVFEYTKLAGPKYNDTLIVSTRIQPGESLDRMSVGRVDLPEAAIDGRLAVRLRIREIDGQVAEVREASRQK